ncbi:MAG TPA: nucleotidyltransferase family protein [Terriglobales bacterium]
MKAFLLAAGYGTRLRPLTDTTPKCLLPVRGVPILQIWLETCARFGIDEVLINVHAQAGAVRAFLSRYSPRTRVHVVEEEQLLGSAGTLLRNRDWVDGESSFWVFYADVLHNVDLSAMMQFHEARRTAATIGAYFVPDPSRCGILEVGDDDVVTDFVEKPRHSRSNLAFSGLLLGSQQLLDAIPRKQPVDIGFDVLPYLVGKMTAYRISSYVIDIGTLENYQTAQRTWPGVLSQGVGNNYGQ